MPIFTMTTLTKSKQLPLFRQLLLREGLASASGVSETLAANS